MLKVIISWSVWLVDWLIGVIGWLLHVIYTWLVCCTIIANGRTSLVMVWSLNALSWTYRACFGGDDWLINMIWLICRTYHNSHRIGVLYYFVLRVMLSLPEQPRGSLVAPALVRAARCWFRFELWLVDRFNLLIIAHYLPLIGPLCWPGQLCAWSRTFAVSRVSYWYCCDCFDFCDRSIWSVDFICTFVRSLVQTVVGVLLLLYVLLYVPENGQ